MSHKIDNVEFKILPVYINELKKIQLRVHRILFSLLRLNTFSGMSFNEKYVYEFYLSNVEKLKDDFIVNGVNFPNEIINTTNRINIFLKLKSNFDVKIITGKINYLEDKISKLNNSQHPWMNEFDIYELDDKIDKCKDKIFIYDYYIKKLK
jgi:hypothetical protein